MTDIKELTVLIHLQDRLSGITDKQIDAMARKLKEPGAKHSSRQVIGVIESRSTRALYTLYRMLGVEISMEKANAEGAIDEIDEREHTEKAALLDMLADVTRELFWSSAKIDLGFYEETSVGVRSEWRLIKEPDDVRRGLPHFLASMGGAEE
jgi:hypothetical protein